MSSTFEALVVEILRANNFIVSRPESPRAIFDFSARLGQSTWAVEVKYYRTPRAQPSLIERAAIQLQHAALATNNHKAMLIVSAFIERGLRETLQERFHISLVDRADLSIWAANAPELVDPLAAVLGESPIPLETRDTRFNESIELQVAKPARSIEREGQELCQEVRDLGRGKKHWKAYEDLCERILRFLFPNDLSGWHKQKRTDDGLNRYDLVCRLSPTTEFWRFVDGQLGSRYVLFEFKNYVGQIGQGQVLTTEKYLLPLALRRFGIVTTRRGANKPAQRTLAGAMRESGKMMLVLDDNRVCELLHAKDRGDDPSDLLFQYCDEFLMTLNR